MSKELNPERVTATTKACLFSNKEDSKEDNTIVVKGIIRNFEFNRKAIKEHKGTILLMLEELDPTFFTDKGGGWSFLNACNDKNGELWTGLHSVMEELFCLGMAAGFVKELLPREFWKALPGGMPYYGISRNG